MAALNKFMRKLTSGVNRGVHLAPELVLRLGQSRDHIMHGNAVSDDHQVNIAFWRISPRCD